MGHNGLNRDVPPLTRFAARVDKTDPSGCWLWTGSLSDGRYANFMVNGKTVMVHRWSYEHFVGPIPEGKQIDHICAVTRCVNPGHLRPMDAHENVRAYWREQRRQCRNGHEMTEANTVWAKHNGNDTRLCRTCLAGSRDREHAERRRKRAS